jgi:hypothetical protein
MLQEWKAMEKPEEEEIRVRLAAAKEKLAKQQLLIKEQKIPVLVLMEGWGTAGKGSVIGQVIQNIDPRFFKVESMGEKSEEERRKPFLYRYFRAFLFFTWLNFLQPISSMFFSSIGKAYKGTFLSLTRQIMFLLPLIVALPHFFGIMGVLYAGPIADLLSFAVGLSMVIVEFKHINKLEAELA